MRSRDELSPEDQRRVDEFTHSGIHSVERRPFRPLLLMVILMVVVTLLSVLAIVIQKHTIP
jgi:hypothetical protein